MRIRAAVNGYGNLGKGVERALARCGDMELAAVFTRRKPEEIRLQTPGVPVYAAADMVQYAGDIDVMILCGGSATDLPQQGPECARFFHTVDSFDTHAKIPAYSARLDAALRAAGHVGIFSAGWDPGLFSLARLLGDSILPVGQSHTFWGRGVSQGHSDALRRLPGVKLAVQYTVPKEEAVAAARSGGTPSDREKHLRECFVVLTEGADPAAVEQAIVTMPYYFAEYDTLVHFIPEEEFRRDHNTMPHGGFVLRSGQCDDDGRQLMEFSLQLDSNPAFTASVLVACARAVHRLAQSGERGAKSMLDIPLALLSPWSAEELRAKLL